MKNAYLLLAGITIFFTSAAQQQVTFVGTPASSEIVDGSYLTIPINIPSSANCLTVTVSQYEKSYPLTIKDVTSSMTFNQGISVISTSGTKTSIYYLVSPGVGLHDILISTGYHNNANIKATVSCFSNVDTQFPIAATATKTNTNPNDNLTLNVNSGQKQL